MSEKISPEIQRLAIQLQQQEQQLKNISLQRQSLSYQKMETDNALEELRKSKEGEDVFKVVGPILIKKPKEEVVKELEDTREKLETRLKMIEKSEEKIREAAMRNQDKVREMLKGEGEKE